MWTGFIWWEQGPGAGLFEHDMNFRVPYNAGNCLNDEGNVSFSRKFLLFGVIQIHVNVLLVVRSSLYE
jgi:hypothetical protein